MGFAAWELIDHSLMHHAMIKWVRALRERSNKWNEMKFLDLKGLDNAACQSSKWSNLDT